MSAAIILQILAWINSGLVLVPGLLTSIKEIQNDVTGSASMQELLDQIHANSADAQAAIIAWNAAHPQ